MEPDGSSREGEQPGDGRSDFLLVPAGETSLSADWDTLGRAARLDYLRDQHADLDNRIRARLPDLSVEYLSGAGSWVVRSTSPIPPLSLRQRLAGLPVQVADDERFTALPQG